MYLHTGFLNSSSPCVLGLHTSPVCCALGLDSACFILALVAVIQIPKNILEVEELIWAHGSRGSVWSWVGQLHGCDLRGGSTSWQTDMVVAPFLVASILNGSSGKGRGPPQSHLATLPLPAALTHWAQSWSSRPVDAPACLGGALGTAHSDHRTFRARCPLLTPQGAFAGLVLGCALALWWGPAPRVPQAPRVLCCVFSCQPILTILKIYMILAYRCFLWYLKKLFSTPRS